jgi:hypothetical protein
MGMHTSEITSAHSELSLRTALEWTSRKTPDRKEERQKTHSSHPAYPRPSTPQASPSLTNVTAPQ